MEQEVNIIELLLDELNYHIKNKKFISALIIVFILIDIYSKIKCSAEGGPGDRFKKWYDENILNNLDAEIAKTQLTSRQIYDIRCCLFHEGKISVRNNNRNDILKLHLNLSDDISPVDGPFSPSLIMNNSIANENNHLPAEKTIFFTVPNYTHGMYRFLKSYYESELADKKDKLPKVILDKACVMEVR